MTKDINQQQPKDYLKLVNVILAEAAKADFSVKILSTLVYGANREGYPFLLLRSEEKTAKYNAVITAGFHGDEWYGIDSLLYALNDIDTDMFNLWIFPCANPFGYSYSSRLNGERKGSNWKVGLRPTNELSLIFKNIPPKIDLFVDVHGDVDRYEVYAYERKLPDSPSLAALALNDVLNYFDIYDAQTVYKEKCEGGVVTSKKEHTIEENMFEKRGAPYSITLEIPGKTYGTNRTAGGARLILATLNNYERVRQHRKAKRRIGE